MAYTQAQTVDYLFKKLGYGVAKTDVSTNKSPTNEANASPLLIPADTIWQLSGNISVVTTLPTSNSSVVTIYRDSLSTSVQCTKDSTVATTNATWSTNLTDWIPTTYGSGYQVKVYAGPSGSATPQNYTNLPPAGVNSDSWFFDYQSGILNFGDTNIPAAVTGANVVYVVGARYTGPKGISNYPLGATFGNITINGNTITGNTGVTFGGNITTSTVFANVIGTNGTFTNNVSASNVNATLYGNTIGSTATYSGNITAGNFITTGNAYLGNLTVTNLEIDQGNIIAGNVISTFYGNAFGANATYSNISVSNINYSGATATFGGNVNGTFVGNVYGTVITATQPYITTVGTLTNVTVAGNTTTGNLITNTFFWANGAPVIFTNYVDSNVALFLSNLGSNTITTSSNVNAGNVNSSFYGNIHADIITPYKTSVTTFNSSTAVGLPIGGNTARPSSPTSGQIRYNSDYNTVEFYNGVSWISVIAEINGQNFYGDGTNVTFTLSQATTQNGILVSINGTVQQPGYAYTVTGNQITFTQVPLVTDQIDIRFLAASVTLDNIFNDNISVNGNVTFTGLLAGPQTTKASNAPGAPGQMCWDSNYIYVCTALNTWKRSPLTGGY
jgi:hypothetical protein